MKISLPLKTEAGGMVLLDSIRPACSDVCLYRDASEFRAFAQPGLGNNLASPDTLPILTAHGTLVKYRRFRAPATWTGLGCFYQIRPAEQDEILHILKTQRPAGIAAVVDFCSCSVEMDYITGALAAAPREPAGRHYRRKFGVKDSWTLAELTKFANQALRIIQGLHGLGIVHGDLAGHNFVVDVQGSPWLIDLDTVAQATPITAAQDLLVFVNYTFSPLVSQVLPPERARYVNSLLLRRLFETGLANLDVGIDQFLSGSEPSSAPQDVVARYYADLILTLNEHTAILQDEAERAQHALKQTNVLLAETHRTAARNVHHIEVERLRQIESLQEILAQRDMEIANAQQYAASLQDMLTRREQSLSEAEQYVGSLRELLKHREAEISSAHQYIASLQSASAQNEPGLTEAKHGSATNGNSLSMEQSRPNTAPVTDREKQGISGAPLAICTIVSKNYLAHARCLVDSFLEHNPDGQAFVLLVDRVDGYFDPAQERFITVLANDLEIPNFQWFSFRYTIMELNTAVKPFFLEYLFKRFGLQKLCYFDPDILIYGKLDGLLSTLDEFGIVLTPHLLGFLDDEHNPNELSILLSGAYNLGFIGLSQHNDLETFLHWWQRKLLKYCTADVKNGLFVDQRWIDLVPSIFASVSILRDPGYNVAYWNLYGRHVEPSNGSYRVNGSLLKFFHFSGFSPDNLYTVSKHQNRFTLEDIGEFKSLFLDYSERLLRSDYRAIRQWPYAYGAFDDGAPIPDLARWLYRETDVEGQRWPNPFATVEPDAFRNWLNEPADETGSARPVLTRLAMYLYYRRADLQQAFPDVLKEHRLAYANWFVMSVKEQHGIHDVFLEPIKESLELTVAEAAERKPPLSYPSLISIGTPWVLRVNYSRFGRLIKRLIGQKMVARLKRLFFNTYRTLFEATIKKAPAVSPLLSDSIAASRPTLSPGANVIGYIRSETGVGEAARSTLRSLRYHNFPVAYTNIIKHDLARKEDDSCADVPEGHPYDINLLHVNADQVMAVHDELGPEFFAGKYNVGFWFWEMASLPEIWHDRFGLFKEIWVASTYTQAAVAAVSPIPVIRMRPSIEVRQIAEGGRQALGLPEDKFVFLFAFDLFSICERKNPFGLIEAYRRAFGDNHPEAALVIKVNNFHRVAGLEAAAGIEKGLQQKVMDAVQSVSGMLLDEEMDRDRVNALYRACDCFVSLHRSEGFGLSLAEAMCLGKPCIATAYSSNIDFMTAANSYLVNYRLVELERDYGPYERGSVWADPDIDHAATLMRHVFENSDEAASRGALAAEDIRRFYSPAVAGREMIGRLTLIARDHWAA